MKSHPLLCLLLSLMPLCAEEIPRPVLLQAERFTLARTEAFDLLTADLSDVALRKEMLKRVAAKSARLDQFLMLRSVSGQSAKLEQIDEFPYPSDYEPAQIPSTLVLADQAGATALEVVKSHVPPPIEFPLPPNQPPPPPPPPQPPWPPEPTHKVGIGLQTTPAPSKLAFRNLGDTVEITPTLNFQTRTATVRVTTETVRYLGDQIYLGVAQPRFQARKMNLTSAGKLGQAIFLGTCNVAIGSGVRAGQQTDEVSLQFITISAPDLPSLERPPVKLVPGDPFADSREPPRSVPQVMTAEQIASKTLRFQFDLISLPTVEAFAMVEASTPDSAMLTRLQELVRAHAATAEASFEIRTSSGVRSPKKQVTPFQYADDFSRFYLPQTLTLTNPKILDLLYLHGGGTEAQAKQFDEEMITVADPNHVKTRNLGLTLDLTPMLMADGTTMKLSLTSELVRHVGDRKITRDQKPIFETQRLNTTVLLQNKLAQLLGTMSRPQHTGAPGGNEDDRVSFAFITGFVE